MSTNVIAMKDHAMHILRKNHLSVTDSRCTILHMFLQNTNGAVRHCDIEQGIPGLDRVTIYRTLQVFSEKGIIHSIPSLDGAVRYALCHSGCEEGHHHDNHVHFVCSACGTTQCLEEVNVPPVIVPAGYQAKQIEMVITGVCNRCRQ
ncbi:MAG: transcriptional repressor [Bacteroidota bacterium]